MAANPVGWSNEHGLRVANIYLAKSTKSIPQLLKHLGHGYWALENKIETLYPVN